MPDKEELTRADRFTAIPEGVTIRKATPEEEAAWEAQQAADKELGEKIDKEK